MIVKKKRAPKTLTHVYTVFIEDGQKVIYGIWRRPSNAMFHVQILMKESKNLWTNYPREEAIFSRRSNIHGHMHYLWIEKHEIKDAR